MQKLNLLDAAFLTLESRETPMHVGGVNLFTLPKGVDEQRFLHGIADNMRDVQECQPPFGDRLKMGRLGVYGSMYWEPDSSLDLDYHIRHSALPKPGRYRELFALVSRLHGTLLDRHRPLWEMHLIEGLQNRQFALYSKYHHAAIDGVKSIHLTQSMFSFDPKERSHDSPLSVAARDRYREHLHLEPPSEAEMRNVAERLKATFDSSAHVYGGVKQVVGAWLGKGMGKTGPLALPWMDVPPSSINTEVDGARRFVAQSWPFARIRGVGKALDGTFNDAVLAMCSGALCRYLQNHAELPDKSLKSLVPISLRKPGDIDSSNAVGAISADLATNVKDPIKRFQTIQASMRAGKDLYKDMSAAEATLFNQLTQLPGALILLLGLSNKLPPYNTTISNVPGPRKPMYLYGAKLDGIYPASIVTFGMALNITLVTYDDQVDFGILACRRSLPQVQRLIDYMEEALVELEDAAGIGSAKPKSRARTKAKANTKTAVKAKAKAKPKARAKAAPNTSRRSGA